MDIGANKKMPFARRSTSNEVGLNSCFSLVLQKQKIAVLSKH